MGHYHCEIVLPITEHHLVESAVEQVMRPFNEDPPKGEEDTRSPFWDWYQLGGRFAGDKIQATFNQEKLKAFYEALKKMKVTISGFQCGKQELLPASQIPEVDALWGEYFPSQMGKPCPIFLHSNRNGGMIEGDVMMFKDVPRTLECFRLIFAAPTYDGKNVEAKYMIELRIWNGVTFVDTQWGGDFQSGYEMFLDHIKHYRKEAQEEYKPKDDWLVATVDYHS